MKKYYRRQLWTSPNIKIVGFGREMKLAVHKVPLFCLIQIKGRKFCINLEMRKTKRKKIHRGRIFVRDLDNLNIQTCLKTIAIDKYWNTNQVQILEF